MPYYLYRVTPLHNWQVGVDPPASHMEAMPRPEGELIELPGVEWFSQAQAEADRRNGKTSSEQGVLSI